ncbi:mechanosensitive ion channel domain-containing protein [Cellulomonas edaphi]|uniref:Mechanosensitive ion channel n=1 Tax=Cellulomonas edaphi TaxID=3053468 RepID=A0ABT7S895_9CELL|nr:mechanosensitive ion channel domain-containing protein [Cellulomons edaphi]MDM7831833.1 mechanosensitive ion channel [Cellulomons edaphi]
MIRLVPTLDLARPTLLTALPTKEEAASDAADVVIPIGSILVAAVIAIALSALIGALVSRIGRRSPVAADLTRRSRTPLRCVLVIVAVWIALRLSTDDSHWQDTVEHVLLIALIVAVTWLIGSLAFVLEDAALMRYRTDVADNRHARRVRTQVQVLRRVTVAILVVCAAAGIALTFPSARAFGASLLASAGLLSIVAGLAAQSSLANVFAGMQLAFTDAIRVDDVVVVDGQWGRIEELTLTYVVVHAWDDRRLILPSTYFTTTPFENWTRRAAELLGTVELDVDWQVPVPAMRDELSRLLEATDLWDRRVGILQVVDAVGGSVRVRALASAADAPTLFDLRCYVREGLVAWAQREAPQAIPRTRWEQGAAPVGGVVPAEGPSVAGSLAPADEPAGSARADGSAASDDEPSAGPQPGAGTTVPSSTGPLPLPGAWSGEDTQTMRPVGSTSRLFTGSFEALERSRHFQGPGQDVIDEREQNAEGGESSARGEAVVSPGRGEVAGSPARGEAAVSPARGGAAGSGSGGEGTLARGERAVLSSDARGTDERVGPDASGPPSTGEVNPTPPTAPVRASVIRVPGSRDGDSAGDVAGPETAVRSAEPASDMSDASAARERGPAAQAGPRRGPVRQDDGESEAGAADVRPAEPVTQVMPPVEDVIPPAPRRMSGHRHAAETDES